MTGLVGSFDKNFINGCTSIVNDWPYVYILFNKKTKLCYIGETVNISTRLNEHLKTEKKDIFDEFYCFTNDFSTKSTVLDLEAKLIELLDAEVVNTITNKTGGRNHNFYQRHFSEAFIKLIWDDLKSISIVKEEVEDVKLKDVFKFTPLKALSLEQVEIVNELVNLHKKEELPKIVQIKGGPGTGKTVMSTRMLYDFAQLENCNIAFVSGNTTLNETMKKNFAKHPALKNSSYATSIQTLSQISSETNKKFDIIIVDEAHRLKRKRGTIPAPIIKANKFLNLNDDADQLDQILEISKTAIFMYDEFQSVRPSDIPYKKFQELFNGEEVLKYNLNRQYRIIGGNDYINFVQKFLYNFELKIMKQEGYDFRIFDNFGDMFNLINQRNKQIDKSFIVSGLGFEYGSYSDKNWKLDYDFIIDDQKMIWNKTTKDWINSNKKTNENDEVIEMGCIHTIQGQELNYCGVVFSSEIDYVDGKFVVYRDKYKDPNGQIKDIPDEDIVNYILNIYSVLMTRGIFGVYIYAVNEGLKKYLKDFFNQNWK